MEEEARPAAGQSQAPVKDSTPVYEVGFHVVPTAGEEGVGKAVEAIRKALGDAEIIAESFPQKMQLTYVIERAAEGKREKYAEAYFGWIKFATAREHIPALQESLRAAPAILRSLIIETVREDIKAAIPRAVFSSDRLEGQTLKKPTAEPEKAGVVDEGELDKSIEALVAQDN
jgi:ribosomal protein S6